MQSAPCLEHKNEYVALLSCLPLSGMRMIPKMLRYAYRLEDGLKGSPGLVSYSLRADLLRGELSTLFVWENQESLRNFVRRQPHGESVNTLSPDVRHARLAQWKLKRESLPQAWRQARKQAC